MRSPAQGLLAYLTIFATCTAGILQVSVWVFVAGACVLALISIANHPAAVRTLGGGIGAEGALWLASLLNATASAGAALMTGRLLGWMWGV